MVTRYVANSDCLEGVMQEYGDGPFVRYSDYAQLEAQLQSAEQALAAAREELAAEKRLHAKALASNKQLRREAEAALAAAREENERLTGRTVEAFVLARLETEMIGPSLSPDLCEQAINIIAELRRVRRDLGGGNPLAALRSRADDAGRVDEGAPRKALAWFARRMERKLKVNDHKDHWTTCETQWLFSRVLEEAQELLSAMPDEPWELSEEEKDRIIDEAADVANFALMIADIARQAMPKTRAVLAAADREGE